MYILGISAYYHDSAAVIIKGDEVIAAAQEERFTRKKQDPSFPENAIAYCMKEAGCQVEDISYIAFYDKPFLKFERLLETYYVFSPKGVLSFIKSIPIWIKEKFFLKREIKKGLLKIGAFDFKKVKLLFPEHHLSHAASAFYPSSFHNAAIVTLDGVGEWATSTICHGVDHKITIKKQLDFPHSIGLLYSAFTYYLGFKVNSGEYKLMGLAPYGIKDSHEVNEFKTKIKNKLIRLKADGSIWMDQQFFSFAYGDRMVPDKKWNKLFGIPRRLSESKIEQIHCNMALAIQEVTEEIVLNIVQHAKDITGSDSLCLAGGVALNCVANGKIIAANIFKNVYIQPAAGDAGGALGAALAAYHIFLNQERKMSGPESDKMKGSYLGPRFSDLDIEYVAKKYKSVYHKENNRVDLYDSVALSLSQGKIVGWFQGRMEFGPRALGNRSILGDPRSPEMQLKLNLKIKYRESFRPFAPSVLASERSTYFDLPVASPYMLLVSPLASSQMKTLPEGYHSFEMKKKLYVERSSLPAITHVDHSARVQSVHKETNEPYYNLINAFGKITGIPILVNTSFNIRGEPIVCTPEDAFKCFMSTEMDILVLENFVFYKEEQPTWSKENDIKTTFALD